jgi:hypothetical protein
MPSFTAESTLYSSPNKYQAYSRFNADTGTWVQPQDCGWVKGVVCGAGVAAAIALCAEACVVTGGLACYGCITTALVGLGIGGCADCIPTEYRPGDDTGGSGGGGGGGGDSGCTACLRGCSTNCGLECAGTAGEIKSVCIRECASANAECRVSCRPVCG